jgi:hypothetical protein
MAFWSDAGLEPKRKHKFLLFVGSFPAILVKSVNKPNMDITVGEHKFLGNTYKFPGGVKWNDITATFVDTENDQIIQSIMTYMENAGSQDPVKKGLALASGPSAATPLTLLDKSGAVSALGGGVILQQIDEVGSVVEEWTLRNGWISKLDLGDVAYENDNALSEYKMTITYDWAYLTVQSPASTLQKEMGQIKAPAGEDTGLGQASIPNNRRR